MKIKQRSEMIEGKRFSRVLNRLDGSGYAFDCNEAGVLQTVTEEHIQGLLDKDRTLEDEGVKCFVWHYRQPAIGECECGREVDLAGFTNECECGRLYNWAGQELCHPSLWGEETGEHPADLRKIG